VSSIANTTPLAGVSNEVDPDDATTGAVPDATEIGDRTVGGIVSNGDGARVDAAPRCPFDCAELHALSSKPPATSVTRPSQERRRGKTEADPAASPFMP
jgi:hypothetical protein